MDADYTARITARNEGIEYIDETGRFLFDCILLGPDLIVYVPGFCWKDGVGREATEEEMKKIGPRIAQKLKRIWWLGIYPKSYSVRFVAEARRAEFNATKRNMS